MSVALITGAGRSGGIGAAIAAALAEAGHDVCVADVDVTGANEVGDAVRAHGRRFTSAAVDVSDPDEVRALFDHAERELGRVEVAVANAGIALGKALLELTPDEWRTTIGVNLDGAYFTAAEAARRLIDAGTPGAIVLLGSAASKTGYPRLGAYSASKFGVLGLTQSAAAEWGPHGIRVNAVCPGGIDTSMAHRLYATWAEAAGVSYDEFVARVLAGTPLGRLGSPAEIADAVAFLASDKARYVSGESLNVSGASEVH